MKNKAKFDIIIELISNVMEAYTAAIFITEENGEFLEIYCFQSFCKKININCKIKIGEGLIGWVLREQKNVLAANFERSTKTLGFYEEDEKIKSLIAINFPNKRGVLFVDSKKSYTFTEEKEKIFKQLGTLIYSLIVEQELINNKLILKNSLKAYLDVDLLLEKEVDIKKIAEVIMDNFKLSYFSFVIPEKIVCTYYLEEKKKRYIFEKNSNKYFSDEGLIGWCIKNRKNMIKNREINSNKTFLINKNETFIFSNFAAISIYEKNNPKVGAIGVSKTCKNNEIVSTREEYWYDEEIEMLEKIGKKIFIKILKKEE